MNKFRIFFTVVLLLVICSNVYTQTATKKPKGINTESTLQTQEPLQTAPTAKNINADPTKVTQGPTATIQAAATEAPLKFFALTESCYNKFINGKIDTECAKSTLSRALSYVIIAGFILSQALQIFKLISSRSIEGFSQSTFYRELLIAMLILGYNLHINAPIHAYGENISIFIQTIILILLYWILNPKTSKICVIASTATYAALGAVLYLDILSDNLNKLVLGTAIALVAKNILPQIKANHQNKSVGDFTFVTVFFTWAGNLVRIFTTLQEVKDDLLLAFYLTGAVLYGIVLIQFFAYGKSKIPKKRE